MPKTILIADDNDDLRTMISFQLQQQGYRVIAVSDGQKAVEKARQEKPDLILLDIMMPGVDGTEAGEMLKSDHVTSHIPVIFLTSLIQGDEPTKFAAGNGTVLPKSTTFSALLAKIQEIL
jgi:CheY-like chemotaxis protein